VFTFENVRHCMWRNVYSPQPILAGTIIFGSAYGWTTERLAPELRLVFEEKLPGAVPRSVHLAAPEIVARLAQHIQLLGDVASPFCGVGSRDETRKSADIFFSCRDPVIGPQSLTLAAQIVYRLAHEPMAADRLVPMFKACDDMIDRYALELRTRTMLQTVEQMGIPWFRTNGLVRHAQLGQGVRQQRFWKTMFGSEPVYARDYAKNKLLALTTLSQIMLPVGQFAAVRDVASAVKFANEIGYPVVLKPTDSGRGDSVYVDLRDEKELRAALLAARVGERPLMLQSFFPGDDHRLLIIGGRLFYAGHRIPASVKGDGRHTVIELVEIENRNPERNGTSTLYHIVLDADSDRVLAHQGYTRTSVIPSDRVVRVKGTANVATGGTVVDVTDIIHPDNVNAALRATAAIGLVVAGVDFITPDITKSWHEVGGGFCEINATVGLPHESLTPGRDVQQTLIRAFYPDGDDGRVPTAMVTGTFGKTTTVLMLASILASAGHTVGAATTESIRIGKEEIALGDFAATDGASVVMRDATVTAAVLETARGGLIKRGMYLDRCDVAALLNVEREQIGIDGIETLDEMAALKRKVLDAARKAVVLNADDPRCLGVVPEFASSVRTFLFSRDAASSALRNHRAHGGDVLYVDGEMIAWGLGANTVSLLRASEIPVTKDGLFWQHASNAMAAAGLAIGLGIDIETIREGLRRYGKEYPAAFSRLQIVDDLPVPMLFDYAASPPGFVSTTTTISPIQVSGRRFCALTIAGNRPDWTFAESAAAIAGHFQRYVAYELPKYRRGRKPGEIASRLARALVAAGVDKSLISVVEGNEQAAQLIAREAKPEDFVVVFGSDSRRTIDYYRAAFAQRYDHVNELPRAQA
jgi:cyanophycin synthetase